MWSGDSKVLAKFQRRCDVYIVNRQMYAATMTFLLLNFAWPVRQGDPSQEVLRLRCRAPREPRHSGLRMHVHANLAGSPQSTALVNYTGIEVCPPPLPVR